MWERKINDDIPVIGGKCVFIPAKTNYICPDGDDGTDVQVLYSFTIFTLHASKIVRTAKKFSYVDFMYTT